MFYNADCVEGARKYLKDNSVDLIITDPPYGIHGDTLHKHYNRNENYVIDGYIEVPAESYFEFSCAWIKEAERVLRPGGSMYIVSGYTHLRHILNALAMTKLKELNHIIWKYNFGIYTKNKYISSHYHILYYVKPGGKHTFNTNAFYADFEKDENGLSLNYKHREDVWIINREYKPGEIKNKNELPFELLKKMILYSSNTGDLICDFFLGSFSTAKVALGLGRDVCGFELNKKAFDYQMEQIKKIKKGELLNTLRKVPENKFKRKINDLTDLELSEVRRICMKKITEGHTKKNIVNSISEKYNLGTWSVLKFLDRLGINKPTLF
jgi:site-specific DNA-methyltransferase (adenine-specific)